jgi:quinoprotein dehydrogenase-associated probable ABC transporter substrate-binding protein
MRNRIVLALVLLAGPASADTLRVCSDPNNLPFSNRAMQGFENKIAAVVVRDLGDTVSYTWAAQHETFVKRTLNAHKCDVVMGVPVGMDDVAETRPYYASSYVFVTRARDNLDIASMTDPRLRRLKIGVHLMGDDPGPPEAALGAQYIVDNVRGFLIMDDRAKPNPPARMIEAVENGSIDVAAAWGPMAGYFALHSPVALRVTPITNTAQFAPLKFRFAIAMGVREDDPNLRRLLDKVLSRERTSIATILRGYGVPLVEMNGGLNG